MLGWNSFANLLYVDQPGETGFTYFTEPVRTLLLCMDMIFINARCNIVNKLYSRLCIRRYTGILSDCLSFILCQGQHVSNKEQISHELWTFMLMFYEHYPRYANLDLYVFGESYG